MSDVLSQTEIDALLNAFQSGELDADDQKAEPELRVKSFDFRTANRFSKEQMRTLNIIYDNFAKVFATYLSGTLRAMCDCDVISVEELKYQEFVNALPTPVVLAIVRMAPLTGPTLVEISPNVAYGMISHLLGGTSGTDELTRSFTEIELVLLERIIRQFIGLLSESWERVTTINATLERIETSPQFAQIVALNETVVIVSINIRLGDMEGLVNICLPYITIEPVGKQLNTKLWFQSVSTDVAGRAPAGDGIALQIQNTLLPITAAFNSTSTSLRDVLGLQVGDVVQLEHGVRESLMVRVGHLSKFRAAIGLKDGRYAVKISEIIREEDMENE